MSFVRIIASSFTLLTVKKIPIPQYYRDSCFHSRGITARTIYRGIPAVTVTVRVNNITVHGVY